MKRTDQDEISINLTARDRLSSLLQAIRLLRSCISAIPRDGSSASPSSRATPVRRFGSPVTPIRVNDIPRPNSPPICGIDTPDVESPVVPRTDTARPDSLDPTFGEHYRRGQNKIDVTKIVTLAHSHNRSIGTWLADIPVSSSSEEGPPLSHAAIKRIAEKPHKRRASRQIMPVSPGGSFNTHDGVPVSKKNPPPDKRCRRSKSWCSDMTILHYRKIVPEFQEPMPDTSRISKYQPTIASSNVSIIHKRLTSDRIAIAKAKRKEMTNIQRTAVDRILTNLPSDSTAGEVERVLWEGANPMTSHKDYKYFFIRAAHEMAPEVLETLIHFGADITKTAAGSHQCYSALHAATSGRRLATMQYLASLGWSLESVNSSGQTPLHLAVRSGAFEIVRYLCNMGVDVNQEADNGDTPLRMALNAGDIEGKKRSLIVEMLLANGAMGDVVSSRDANGRWGDSKGRSVLGI